MSRTTGVKRVGNVIIERSKRNRSNYFLICCHRNVKQDILQEPEIFNNNDRHAFNQRYEVGKFKLKARVVSNLVVNIYIYIYIY